MDDILVLVLMIVPTFVCLFIFLAFLREKEEKEQVSRYAPKILATKSDEGLLKVLANEFKDKLRSSVSLRPRQKGLSDGNVRFVVDPNWQPPPTVGYSVILHRGTDFSVLKGPKEFLPKGTGSLEVPEPAKPGSRRYWFGRQRYEIAVYGAATVIAFAIFYRTLLPILLGSYNIIPQQGFPLHLTLPIIGIVCMFAFFIASYMFGWEILDLVVGTIRGRLIFSKKKPNYVRQVQIIKLLDEGTNQSQIAKRFKTSQQNVSDHVKRLQNKKLIEKIEGGHIPKYRATERGKQIIKKTFGGE